MSTVAVNRFTWVDYAVFVTMLVSSALIGVFFGCFRKSKNPTDFLMAGKSMTTFPVAMSIIASFISAIAILGIPSDVYRTGIHFWIQGFAHILVGITAANLYLPVFWNLQIMSANEYLEMRFNRTTRILGSLIFMLQMCLYMAIALYAPALALAQVTGISVYTFVISISMVCTFYTTLGGMKAVLWTDALQIFIVFGCLIMIVIKGTIDLGGFQKVWEIGSQGNRTELIDWDPDPRVRHTFWSLIFGAYFTWVPNYCVNQAQIQRYLCVKEKSMAMKAIAITAGGHIFVAIFCSFIGLLLYAKYASCDPLSAGIIANNDQLFPLFVMDTLSSWRGVPGLFVAAVFAGSLSTVSSGINSMALLTLEDFLKCFCFPNMSERAATIISKILCFLFGCIAFILVFIAEQLGDILSAALGVNGVVGGPLMGLFTLGMFFPHVDAIGACVGCLSGLALSFWVSIGYQIASKSGAIVPVSLQLNECNSSQQTNEFGVAASMLTNLSLENSITESQIASSGNVTTEIYKLSYLWYSAVGFLATLLVGASVSLVTRDKNSKRPPRKLLSPGYLRLFGYEEAKGHIGSS